MKERKIPPDPITPDESARYKETVIEQRLAWQEIMAVSTSMIEHANQRDWITVDRLHQTRDQMLDAFFREALADVLVDEIQAGITAIQTQDSDIVQLVKNNREELSTEMQRLQSMRNRVKEYISTSGK
jgi:succinate dehydrogenase flavin-adding protein (antitoxin of CptAB toxin-antitoxin module)